MKQQKSLKTNTEIEEISMPFIHVELVEGRSDAQLKAMMQEITDAVEKNTGAPRSAIKVIVNEMRAERFMDGGKLRSEG
jgi:4-oxalocrotonate tautomerase